MPTQVSSMLGSIVRSKEAKAMPCGVYGSYGWSGEAVDILNSRLTDSGFTLAFKPIKVQFRPSAKDVQVRFGVWGLSVIWCGLPSSRDQWTAQRRFHPLFKDSHAAGCARHAWAVSLRMRSCSCSKESKELSLLLPHQRSGPWWHRRCVNLRHIFMCRRCVKGIRCVTRTSAVELEQENVLVC